MEIKLVKPSVVFRTTYLAGLREFQAEGLPWFLNLDCEFAKKNFPEFLKTLEGKSPVPMSVYWAVADGVEYVGGISIRHELNEALKIFGGHIGYDTRPSFRKCGVAGEMLKQALPIAKSIGLHEVLVTCSDDNVASIKVIEKNGGTLRDKNFQYPGGPLKRYYLIQL